MRRSIRRWLPVPQRRTRPRGVFERFTDRARRVIPLAQEEAQRLSAPTGHIPFTPRAKKVLELSLREALQLGHNYIGTEHILLGLIREGKGVAAQVLVKLGGNLDRVRQQVIALEQENPTTEELPPAA